MPLPLWCELSGTLRDAVEEGEGLRIRLRGQEPLFLPRVGEEALLELRRRIGRPVTLLVTDLPGRPLLVQVEEAEDSEDPDGPGKVKP